MQLAPIALFVYNRPEHTRKTIEALKKNTLASQSDLVIFSDATKSSTQNETVRQVRDYIAQIDGFKSVTVVERESNYGLANSIIDGVTMLCNKHGNVIVLEDDLETSPFFLDYMNNALLRYADEPKVMQISGHMFDVSINCSDDAFFLPFTTSWGWATWKQKWDFFDANASCYTKIKEDPSIIKLFNLENSYPYFQMLEAQRAGKIDSWAIRWYLSVFMLKGLVLYPKNTFVNNIGFDGTGTHRAVSPEVNTSLAKNPILKFPELIKTIADIQQVVYMHLKAEFKKPFIKRLAVKFKKLLIILRVI